MQKSMLLPPHCHLPAGVGISLRAAAVARERSRPTATVDDAAPYAFAPDR